MQTGMQTVNWSSLSGEEQQQLLSRPAMADSSTLSNTVSEIITAIRTEGDSALLDYSKRFDKLEKMVLSIYPFIIASIVFAEYIR